MSDPIVRLEHCRRLGYCARGLRAFCDDHGIDWQAFRECGMPAAQLEATGDAMAIRAAELARSETEGGEL